MESSPKKTIISDYKTKELIERTKMKVKPVPCLADSSKAFSLSPNNIMQQYIEPTFPDHIQKCLNSLEPQD